jgi:Ca2+-binding RTX toxin-like protein
MEGRAPSATYANFDEAAYLADYSDLGTGGITADTALNHYLTFGIDEGRVGKNDNGTTISSNTGSTFTLTTGADALTGTEGNDTFVATEASLSSADVLDGAGGTDTLRYASSGAAAVTESGFEANSVETVQVTSQMLPVVPHLT